MYMSIFMHNVTSWPAYRFLRRQVRWSGIPVSCRIFQFVVICTAKGFGVVNSGCFSGTLLFFLWSNRCWQFVKLVPNWERKYIKAVYCHPAYLTYMRSTSCKNLGWMKHKLESRLPGEISIASGMQMTPSLWQKTKRN